MGATSDDSINDSITCATEAWNMIQNIVNDCYDGLAAIFGAICDGTVVAAQAIWQAIVWSANNILLPVAMTGVNIVGYFFDKFLYGSPGLRPYLHDGLLASDIPEDWRVNLRNNTGWDIYENMGPLLDNTFGILGLGIGGLNVFNHFATSYFKNLVNYSHIMGDYGVFGEQGSIEDKRETAVKIGFGILSAPFLVGPLLVTNGFDAFCAFTKNFFQSFGYNVARTVNLLGEKGVFGPRITVEDTREMPAQIIYGILSSPFVVVVSAVTNVVDAACAFTKNFFQSFGYNVARTVNLLGENGVFGPRITVEDTREMPAQIIYGILSSPFVAVVSAVTNVVDAACAFTKNFFQSFGYNVARTVNLLGENGVFGPRITVEDTREMPAQIIYGILSSPFVAVVSAVTNVVDAACAFTKNFFQSFGYNVARTVNLLGENGVFGPRITVEDTREMPAQIIYGILSSPFVAVVSAVTNVVDAACAFTKNFFQSFGYNVARTVNLLGENGVFGPRITVEDTREMPAQIIYGILSSPFVAVVSAVTNVVDAACAFTKNFFQSFGYNVARTVNLLGENGVFGPRITVEDTREMPAQIIYGVLSAPFVAVVSAVTNVVDAACAFTKNFFQSFGYNVARTVNLLGEDGVFGPRITVDDTREMPAQIIYGVLSSPFVAVVSVVTNTVDMICAFSKNFGLSFGYNVARTYNLLGEDGVFGPRITVEDTREMPAQIIYGVLSSPFVAVVSVVTNVVDAISAFSKNFGLSFGYNVTRTYNLLGEDGVYGPSKTVVDTREMPAQIIYGILSSPFVAVVSTVTNVVDAACAFTKNFFQSFGYNVARTVNLLGENGVFGPRITVEDTREMPAQIIYGILSSPFVAVVSTVTNVVDAACAFTKNFFQSFGYNVARTVNLLAENGVFGPRITVDDTREMPAQIIYGILSSPFVAVVSAVTNVVDAACAFTKNFFQSFGYNVARTVNLLGENGVFGPRITVEDTREMPAQIIYGILSSPFVAVVSAVTNVVDAACAFTKNFFQSFGYNVARTVNLLGENGVFGPRITVEDTREMPAQIIYGILSSPFVAVVSAVTNVVDAACAFTKNFFQSFGYNVARTVNLLGENGVFGPRITVDDTREMPAQIIYGILSSPFVAVVSAVTNVVDAACAFTKNFFQSFGCNVARTFNLLGEDGVFGARKTVEDKREMPAQIVYGVLSAPFVAVTSAVTNVIDGACAVIKNLSQSCYHNLRSTFNLLGEHGVMGPRRPYEDTREMPAKIVYGVLSSPFVGIAAAVTNTVDGVCAYFKNYEKTIKKPAIVATGIVGGSLLAIPTFLARKTIKGLYNCTVRPIVDCANGKSFSSLRMLNGVANVVTCGVFAAVKEVFKACTGYSSRFGFPQNESQNNDSISLLPNPFNEVQNKFKDAIQLASSGKFPGVKDGQGRVRSIMRLFYGMHHKVEDILKVLHDAYREYADELNQQHIVQTSVAYNMNSFFQSAKYIHARNGITLRKGEESLIDRVETYLRPTLSRSSESESS